MATLDKVKITLPGGDVFEGTDNVRVVETHEPFWLFDGASTIRTLAESISQVDNDTAQAYVGTGSRVRTWTVEFVQSEGSTDSWGSASNSDDVIVKAQELGQAIATAGIDSTNTATLEYGEYSSGGSKSAQDVVPGEINLPVAFGPDESATTFRPSMTWIDAVDLNQTIHS